MAGFRRATKERSKLRMALAGPAGSGKTYSALAVASALAASVGGRVGVVDTEHGSASKYADQFDFDALELESFHPQRYIEAIEQAREAGYAVLVLDSLSHAWMGKDGALELKDRASRRAGVNDWTAWRDVTPLHNALVEAMISAGLHLIVTLRSKTEHVQEKDSQGKTVIRKVGLAPVQREGLEYEFDVYGDLDQDNNLIIGKTRCSALAGQVIAKPGKQLAKVLIDWLGGTAPTANGNGHVALPEKDESELHVCEECQRPILTQDGQPIDDTQAGVIHERYDRLLCREHRPAKATATA